MDKKIILLWNIFDGALQINLKVLDLFRAAGSQKLELNYFGISSLQDFNPETIKDEINKELLDLSEAHHQRYFPAK